MGGHFRARAISPIGRCDESVCMYRVCKYRICRTVLVSMVLSGECWGEDGKKKKK